MCTRNKPNILEFNFLLFVRLIDKGLAKKGNGARPRYSTNAKKVKSILQEKVNLIMLKKCTIPLKTCLWGSDFVHRYYVRKLVKSEIYKGKKKEI